LLILIVDDAHLPSADTLVDPYVFIDGLDLPIARIGQTLNITK